MKYIFNKYFTFFAALSCLSLASCDYVDGEGEDSENAVYMATSGSNGVMPFVLESDGGTAVVTPRLANITDRDVMIRVEYDESVVTKFNKLNGTMYKALPISAFKLINEGTNRTGAIDVKINKGDFAAQLGVVVGELDTEEFPTSQKYAIPLSITSTSEYKLIRSQRTALLILNRPIITSVGHLNKCAIRVKPTKVWDVPEWTIQMSALYYSLDRGTNLTTAFISNWAGSEFYTRINAKTGIQVKNGRDGDDTWTNIPLEANKWLHIAYVHKDNTVTVYVNGRVHKVFPTGAIWMSDESWIQFGNGDYNDYVRELRFWSKALTEAEINDNLYLPLSPDTPNLEAYLPLTKEAGITDLIAPKDEDVKENVEISGNGQVTWLENVKFPADGLVVIDK